MIQTIQNTEYVLHILELAPLGAYFTFRMRAYLKRGISQDEFTTLFGAFLIGSL